MDVKIINKYLRLIAKGDEQALNELYRLVGGRMLSVALGITRDRQLAEDAVQEALIKIVRRAETFQRAENGYGWICTIVRNESLNIIRRYRPESVSLDEFYNLADVVASSENNQRRIEVAMAVEKLTAPERELIWYKYTLEMSVREIAAKVGMSKSTVASRIVEAERKLREYLT